MKMQEFFRGSQCIVLMWVLNGVCLRDRSIGLPKQDIWFNYVDDLRLTTIMPPGKAVPEAIQWIIIRLSAKMTSHEIAMYTDIGERKIRDILGHFKKTGDANVPKRERPTLRRTLGDEEIQVILAFFLFSFDLTTLLASIQNPRSYTRPVPRWATPGAGGNSWRHSVVINNLEGS